jgi:hypothetical protein
MRRLIGVVVATLVAGIALVGGQAQAAPAAPAPPASEIGVQYTSYNGRCEVGEVCLYYNSNCQGSFADFGGWVDNFSGYVFLSSGAGKDDPVKNNAASARNLDTTWTARIWFNSNQSGTYDNIGPSAGCRNLVNTYNDNASLSWYRA